MAVVHNEENELISTRIIIVWKAFIYYIKFNTPTCKDHLCMSFIDQMLDQLAKKSFYCFLDGYSGYNQISIALEDHDKMTLTWPYGTFTLNRMSFDLCNTKDTFQRCTMSTFLYMVEELLKVFMNDFSIVGNSFNERLDHWCVVILSLIEVTLF